MAQGVCGEDIIGYLVGGGAYYGYGDEVIGCIGEDGMACLGGGAYRAVTGRVLIRYVFKGRGAYCGYMGRMAFCIWVRIVVLRRRMTHGVCGRMACRAYW